MSSSIVLMVPTTTSAVRVTRLRRLPPNVDQAAMTLAGSSVALPVSARYSDFVRAPMGPIERSSGHGAWKAEVSAALDVGESWNLGLFLAHALKAHERLQEQHRDVPGATPRAVWATGAVDVIDLRILPVGHIETKLRQALGVSSAPDLFLLPPDNLGDVPAELRAELEARGTRLTAPVTMAEALAALGLPSDWAREAASDLAGWRGDPYRGLEAYQAEHRPIFFGRASARAEALERLRTRAEQGTSLLVIHGKSGVGKSSLAMAGLLDDVVEQVPGRAPFGTATIRFGGGATPLAALSAGFSQALGREDASALQSSSATEWLGTWPENTEPRTVLLILDQLEQALLADEADTIAFGEAIASLVRTRRVWIIATLRSDRIDLLERAPALAEMADGDALYRLVRPTLAELGEIIRAPAKLAGIEFEESNGTDLVNLLTEEAMRAPDSLPLLQVTLMRLADQRDADGRVGLRDYDRIGGFSGAVGRLADETVSNMVADGIDGRVVDRTLASLVRIDPDTDRVDARVIDPNAQTAEVQQVLSALVEARLTTASTVSEALDPDTDRGSVDSTGPNDSGRRVRLAHETLIREWPRLHDLAARLRSELSLRDRLEDDALRWDQDGRPQGDLIGNTARLTAAEALIADGLATPSPQAQTYVEASRDEVECQAERRRSAAALEQRTRARRRTITAAALVAAVILGLAGLAINENQRSQAAQQMARAAEQAAEKERAFKEAANEAQRRAEAQLEQTQITESALLTEKGGLAFARADFPSAISLAYSGLPQDEGLSERPIVAATERLLRESLVRNRLRSWLDLRETSHDNIARPTYNTFASAKIVGTDLIVSNSRGLRVISIKDGLHEIAFVEGNSQAGLCILENRFAVAIARQGTFPPYDKQIPGLLLVDLETREGTAITVPYQLERLACNNTQSLVYFMLENGGIGHFSPRTQKTNLFNIMPPDEAGRAEVVPLTPSVLKTIGHYWVDVLHSNKDGSALRIGLENRRGDWACAVTRPLGEVEAIGCIGEEYDSSHSFRHISSDGRYGLTVAGEILDFETGKAQPSSVNGLNFSRGFFRTDARDLVIGFSDKDLRVVDVDTMENLLTVPVAVGASGRTQGGSIDGNIEHWEKHGLVTAVAGNWLYVLRLVDDKASVIWKRKLKKGGYRVLVSGDGSRLVLVNVTSGLVSVMAISNGKALTKFELPQTQAEDLYKLSHNGDRLIQLTMDGWIKEWATSFAGQSFSTDSIATLAYATYIADLEGFVASSKDGLFFLGGAKDISFEYPALHKDQSTDQSAWSDIELAKKYPSHIPFDMKEGRSNLARAGFNAFLSAGVTGLPALWELKGDSFEYGLLDLDGGPPLKYLREVNDKPSLLNVSVSPSGTHAITVQWNNEGHCLFALKSSTLIKCLHLPHTGMWRWVGQDLYILYVLSQDDPRRDQGYKYATRILSTSTSASEEPVEVPHKSFSLALDGSRWLVIQFSRGWSTIQNVLVGSLDGLESTGFSFEAVYFDERLAQSLMNEGKLFVGQRFFLPLILRLGGSDNSIQVAAIDITEKQITCAFDFDFKARTTPLFEPTSDPDVFIVGARAKLVNVQTCESLETLNPTENRALAVHIANGEISILLDNGSILKRPFYPPLAMVIEDARPIAELFATTSSPIGSEP